MQAGSNGAVNRIVFSFGIKISLGLFLHFYVQLLNYRFGLLTFRSESNVIGVTGRF